MIRHATEPENLTVNASPESESWSRDYGALSLRLSQPNLEIQPARGSEAYPPRSNPGPYRFLHRRSLLHAATHASRLSPVAAGLPAHTSVRYSGAKDSTCKLCRRPRTQSSGPRSAGRGHLLARPSLPAR